MRSADFRAVLYSAPFPGTDSCRTSISSIDRRQHVATVTFDRPAKANALNPALMREIEAAAIAFADDTETRVVIFTGAGRHFSSGADLSDGGTVPVTLIERRRRARLGERVMRALLEMDQITIGAWNGAAMGGGGCIAAAMDLRVGAEDCFMQFPEIDIGINLMWQSLRWSLAGGCSARKTAGDRR
ncbi:MAG: enoyl-CoA hydratase/isomerase family protein [Gammaproteobacteria bacterium]|nr:enoyl-CoA hydratase/isomerase family protein [Gammaproteobacteria bacterium]